MADGIDVLTPDGLFTREVLSRHEVHRQGKHHRAVHLYLFNSRGEVLLQKRSQAVDHYPGLYGISVTGHVDAGESSGDAVERELREELGLDAGGVGCRFMFSYFQEMTLNETYIDRQFNDVYVARADVKPARIRFDPHEVAEVTFVEFSEFCRTVRGERSGLAPVYAKECESLCYLLKRGSSGKAVKPER